MKSRCPNVDCAQPIRWLDEAWRHTDTGTLKCLTGDTPPLAQRHDRSSHLLWHCECGTWVVVSQGKASCTGRSTRPHPLMTWTPGTPPVTFSDLAPPVDTSAEVAESTADAEPKEEVEFGIEYHYAPGRWHVLPNIVFTDESDAWRAVRSRTGDYRVVKRRAPSRWEPIEHERITQFAS